MRVTVQTMKIGVLLLGVALALPVCAQNRSQAAPGATEDPVVATVGGRTVRMSDLETHFRKQDPASFVRLRQQVYDVNRRVLDDLVGSYLIEDEARRRNVTVEALMAEETPKRMEPVTDAQVRALYDQSRERAEGASFENLRPAIVSYLERQRPVEARRKFIDELRGRAENLTIRLDVPRTEVAILPNDPVTGPAEAPIEIVEFADFQCPYCRQVTPVIKQILAKYGDRVRFAWKDFPLPNHPDARPAAEAAQCARDQGQFWPYHDKLFAGQEALSVANLKQWAADLGMDAAKFNACFDGGTYRDLIEADLKEGTGYGVSSTPTVFVNGRAVVGAVPFEDFAVIVEEELAR